MNPYDKNDTKKWKLKGFRKGNKETTDFQVESMKNKIKQVKNPKKKIINIQNIEPLVDVLDPSSNDVIVEDVDSDSDSDSDSETITHDFLQDDTNTDTLREGIESTPNAKLGDDMYTSKSDNIYEGGGDNGCSMIGNALSAGFDKISETIDALFYNFASLMASTNQKNKQEVKDTHIIKKYVYWFFAVLIGLFVVLNWFLIMFFKDTAGLPTPIHEDTNAEEKQKIRELNKTLTPDFYNGEPSFARKVKDSDGTLKGFYGLLYWFLRYPFAGSDTLMYVSTKLPNYIESYLPLSMWYVFLLVVCIVGVYYVPRFLATVVSKSLQMDPSDPYLSIVQTMLFIAYFLSCITSASDEDAMKFWTDLSNIHVIGGPIIVFLIQIALLLYVFLVAPIIFCLVLSCFILYYSIAPILKMDPQGPLAFYRKILSHIEFEYNMVKEPYNSFETTCPKPSLFATISYYLQTFSFATYKYSHIIAFILLFVISIIEYSTSIKTNRIKDTMMMIALVAIVGVLAMVKLLYDETGFNIFLRDYDKQKSNIVITYDQNYKKHMQDKVSEVIISQTKEA
jgi:hypothetical protein